MTRTQLLELSAGLVLLGVAVGAAAYWSRAAPTGRPAAFPVSRPAEPIAVSDLELLDLSGRPVRLRDLRGRVVLLNFWATWCAPCREEMPGLETLARELGPRGLSVVGVNFKESRQEVEAFVQQHKLTFPMLLDSAGQAAKSYQVFALPVSLLVDRRGMIVGTVLGIRDWVGPDARAYLGQLLVGAGGLTTMPPPGVAASGLGDLLARVAGAWSWRPAVLLVVGALAALYVRGWWRLHRAPRTRGAAPGWRLAAYLAGLASVILALCSPIELLAELSFTAHMIQHQLLIMAAPPLLLLAAPFPMILWGLPPRVRRRVGAW